MIGLSCINKEFSAIRLDEMDEVKLMNRVDQKFCINNNFLPDLLAQIIDDYYVLEINNVRLFPYYNTYFDTCKDSMFNDHVRGKSSRFKIRERVYAESQSTYFEIKFKNNKGKTFKNRVELEKGEDLSSTKIEQFLKEHSPFKAQELIPVLKNNFMRMTLVSKTLDERITIDSNVSFQLEDAKVELNKIAIIEVKSEGYPKHSKLVGKLRDNRLSPKGFSKYITGRSLLDHTVKNNAYRIKLRQLEKISNKFY